MFFPNPYSPACSFPTPTVRVKAGLQRLPEPSDVGSSQHCTLPDGVDVWVFFFWPDESFDEDDFDEEAYYAALGTRPALNMDELDSSYQQVIELFSICTSEDPKKRPSAAHVVAVLEASLPPELRA